MSSERVDVASAVRRIAEWMTAHRAPLIAKNLAPAATEAGLARAEGQFGPLPADLRALWSAHDGQVREGNGFIEAFDFFSIELAIAQQEDVLRCIAFARESKQWWEKSGGTDEELHSDRWIPFAGRDSDSLAVHGITGRVFRCDHDDSPKMIAPSLGQWFEAYAQRVEADDYKVKKGFGGQYLSLRDREAERRDQEEAERAREHKRMRRTMPLTEQFANAVAADNADRCTEVLEDALDRADQASFDAAVTMLFERKTDAGFIATALRTVLRSVTLTKEQWGIVAKGGEKIGNNAIRDVALGRAAQ